MTRKYIIFILILLSVVPLLGACSGSSAQELPEYVTRAPHSVQTAYRFAMEHPEMLTHQPCYCGCGVMGHMSSLQCFIRDVDDRGRFIFDNHGAGCGICVDIALDVKRLSEEGFSQLQIRRYIDTTYGVYGPPTDTPMPEA